MAVPSAAMGSHREPLAAAAFGATPGSDAFAAASDGDPRTRWLAAVVLGGQGHYAAAATVLRALLAHHDPLWASLAASTLASHRRQLGWHAAARRLDALALRSAHAAGATAGIPDGVDAAGAPAIRATAGDPDGVGTAGAPAIRARAGDPDGVDAAGARSDALIGLAADTLGLGDLATAHRLVAAVGQPANWRTAVRLSWVRAELALATGDPRAALTPARAAVAIADRAHAVRHAAKSRLVLAAALTTAQERATADDLLHELVAVAAEHALLPLRWPAELLLAGLHSHTEHGELHRSGAFAALRFVLRRADAALRAAAESSRWVPSGGFHSTDSAERSSAGEIRIEICTRLCQGSTPRDR